MARSAIAVALVALFALACVAEARELKGMQVAIGGCVTYATIAGGRRVCRACSGGLIPGPLGDRCIRTSTTVGPGGGIANCRSFRTLAGGRRVCTACIDGWGLSGDVCVQTRRPLIG